MTKIAIFEEQLRSIDFPDYLNNTCASDAYQESLMKFLSIVDFFPPIRTLRVQSITKLWFDIGVLHAIWNGDKHYKNTNHKAEKLTKAILSVQRFYSKRLKARKNFT